MSPNSIAAQVVEGLLAGGATVVATSHSFKPSIKAWAKQAYREHATGNAKLWLVPANLSSYRDVDALVDWVGHEQKKTSGATTTILKPRGSRPCSSRSPLRRSMARSPTPATCSNRRPD